MSEHKKKLTVLTCGDFSRQEFQPIREILATRTDLHTTEERSELLPDWLLFCQAAPDTLPQTRIEALVEQFPLTRKILLLGSLCEGEQRTGSPRLGLERIYWHEWVTRIEAEIASPSQAPPPTVSQEELILARGKLHWPLETRKEGLVGIFTQRPEMDALLALACTSAGRCNVSLAPQSPRTSDLETILFDATDLNAQELSQMERLKAANPGAELLLLLDFPRIETCNRARRAGASQIFSKPFAVHEVAKWIA